MAQLGDEGAVPRLVGRVVDGEADVEALGRPPDAVPRRVGAPVERHRHAEHARRDRQGEQEQQRLSRSAAQVARGKANRQPQPAHQRSPPRSARPARSPATEVPAPSRVCATIAPSRMVSSRSAVLATRASCVTISSVWPRLAELAKQPEDVAGGAAVQVASGLVGEHHQRLVDQGPGHRDALPLAARQLVGEVVGPLGHTEPLEQLHRPAPRRHGATRRRAASAAPRSPQRSARRPGGTPGKRSRRCGGGTPPTGSPRARPRARLPGTIRRRPGGPARRAGAAASTCRSRSAP